MHMRLDALVFVVIGLFVLQGCALRDIYEQTHTADNTCLIEGRVVNAGNQKGLIIVKRYHREGEVFVYDSFTEASADGDYQFHCLAGSYYISAFVDVNSDGEYQQGEHATYHGSKSGYPQAVTVEQGKTVRVSTLTISGPPSMPSRRISIKEKLSLTKNNIGRVVELNNPMFDRENYSLGMWRPVQFIEKIGGGLLFLQDYSDKRIPVVFIHGMNGGPEDWEEVIRDLDRGKFQPWVFYYPSGVRLDAISDYLVTAISLLKERYGYERLYIAAHSMGGLVAWSFVKKYSNSFPDDAEIIRLVMTVNSPMDGMESGVRGVENSPIVVPSWRDVASGSEFIAGLFAWSWPENISYHLIFSYVTGDSGDGTVPLQSQIPPRLQTRAARMHGFNNSHSEILGDADFLALFKAILTDSNQR